MSPILHGTMGDPGDSVQLLEALAACPTAPFHEEYVARRITAVCRELDLPVERDAYGNLVVWHRGASASGRAHRPRRPIAFGAHMDHPALEVVEAEPLTGRLLGGTPRQCFDRPVPIRFIHDGGETPGLITGHVDAGGSTGLRLEASRAIASGAFAVYDVGPFRDVDGLLYQPAADDLAGCAAILSALARCAAQGIPADVAGVFTRCEEVGLIGATLVARQRLLPPDTVVVSLEASRTLPGAEIGGGPVIRVGDATMAFHPAGEAVLRRARARLAAQQPEARVQRQLMSGGTCEAVAYALAGYVTTGIAFPLGNYHNAGPDFTIAAEYIHRADLETGADLLVAAAECMAEDAPVEPVAVRLTQRADEAAQRLRATAQSWALT
ncbi:MAG: M20/M25/M40 family metallo-hydrolase [Chloroflexota bacterium]